MPVTEKVSYTLTPETTAQIRYLSHVWGLNDKNLMPKSRVIAEAIDRAYMAETARKSKSAK